MSVTLMLSLILLALMIIIGGMKGIGAFVSLWINFAIMVVMIMLINFQFNALAVLLVGGAFLLTVTILSAGADERTTTIALMASFIVMFALVILILPAEHLAMAQGFAEENSEELEGLSLGININFVTLGIVAALLATLGAIAEAAIAIAAGIGELLADQPNMSLASLARSGQHLGQQIIGTAVNTVLFGFMADFLSLAIWFGKLHYSLGEIVNAKLFTSSMLSLLYAILGVIVILPITMAIFLWQQRRQLQTDMGTNHDYDGK
ncbi:YibE/F family protein [Weissella cibaria]|uniref:Uncharacterized protein n=1 Tax=Weissella cibaria TaxID=137591 RepID=A0A1X4JMB9_9LACO|nr:YibE/F family protein [Weissella cibaria]AVO65870.1 YibE/F family protein [Weissella cibaria]MBU7543397.1 YibE/F family protein [Weissella cibaria]MCA1355218.1 YibE/F family protein [Weissella cibaria]MCT0957665.1 YibE/F family protein [Weissella cibaria]MCT8400408.1 YibE/F family protein [Weissella cibaria]